MAKASRTKRQKALRKARKDGVVSGAEAKKLKSLGVSNRQISNSNKAKVSKRAQKVVSKGSNNQYKPTANSSPKPERQNQGSKKTDYQTPPEKTGNNFLTGPQANQLRRILSNPGKFGYTEPNKTETSVDDDGNDVTTTIPGDTNYAALANQRLVGKGLKGLRKAGDPINNFDGEGDLQKLLAYATPLATQNNNQPLSGFGVRGSGDINDIREQLGVDRKTAVELGNAFRKKDIEITDPKYQKLINRIQTGINKGKGDFAIPQINRTFTGVDEGKLSIVGTNKYMRDLDNRKNQRGKYRDIQKGLEGSYSDAENNLEQGLSELGTRQETGYNKAEQQLEKGYGQSEQALTEGYADSEQALTKGYETSENALTGSYGKLETLLRDSYGIEGSNLQELLGGLEKKLTNSVDRSTGNVKDTFADITSALKEAAGAETSGLQGQYDQAAGEYGDIQVKSLLDKLGLTGLIGDTANRPDIKGDTSLGGFKDNANSRDDDYSALISQLGTQNKQLGDLNDSFAATNSYLTDELKSSQALIQDQQKRADNLKNSYTPGANPNAMTILAGDFRKNTRRRRDNQLSDLAVLTDLNSNRTNALAGLQLA